MLLLGRPYSTCHTFMPGWSRFSTHKSCAKDTLARTQHDRLLETILTALPLIQKTCIQARPVKLQTHHVVAVHSLPESNMAPRYLKSGDGEPAKARRPRSDLAPAEDPCGPRWSRAGAMLEPCWSERALEVRQMYSTRIAGTRLASHGVSPAWHSAVGAKCPPSAAAPDQSAPSPPPAKSLG